MEGRARGHILRGSARTTATVRRAIQHRQEGLIALSKRYSINPKTVAKWKRRTSVSDLPTDPKDARSTTLSIEEEAIIVAFRRHTRHATGRLSLRLAGHDPAPDAVIAASLFATPRISRLPEVTGGASSSASPSLRR